MKIKLLLKSVILFVLASGAFAQTVRMDSVESPKNLELDRKRGLNMLGEIKNAIKQYYYDKNYHGIDLDQRFKTAADRIKTMQTNSQIFRVIAQVVLDFDDSHTRFLPPNRANRVEYGFAYQMIGQNCVVTDVKKGSDAETKGLKRGDVIRAIGNFAPTRESLWKIEYLLYALNPVESMKILVLNSDGTERELDIRSSFKSIKDREKEAAAKRKQKQEDPYICKEVSSQLEACKLKTFEVEKSVVDKIMREVGRHPKMILDLRGNGGGYVKTEEYFTGYFFDRDVKIADLVMREKTKERVARSRNADSYKGELVVLIDSDSASASEVFSRVMQIEKRATIVGDVSAGAVMTSNFITMFNERGVEGFETVSAFGLNLTIGDLIMSDGKRLEKVGVIPDHAVGPTSQALLDGSDPVLAYAASLLKVPLSSAEAGKFNFLLKKTEDDNSDDDTSSDPDGNN